VRSVDLAAELAPQRVQQRVDERSGALAPAVTSTAPACPRATRAHLGGVVDQVGVLARALGGVDQPLDVELFLLPDHQHHVHLRRQRADGRLAVRGRVADVFLRRGLDVREPPCSAAIVRVAS
jgi:hypothetical protein